MESFKVKSLEHLVNIVTKNLRGVGFYNIPKDKLTEALGWCWKHHSSEAISERAERFSIYDPVRTATWKSRIFSGESIEEFLEYFKELEKDYEVFYKYVNGNLNAYETKIPERIIEFNRVTTAETLKSTPFEYSKEFYSLVERTERVCGVYFLYDFEDTLIYIGRSINLANRVHSSILERKAEKAEVAITSTKSDATVYETYYISKYKPKLNVEANYPDKLTIELPCIRNKEVIKIFAD